MHPIIQFFSGLCPNMKYPGLIVALTLSLLLGATADTLFFGDKNRTVFSRDQQVRDCQPLPNVPFTPWLAVALKDKDDRAMICGGSMNPQPKSCHVLDVEAGAWVAGPELKRTRVGASATCLPEGGCWIFGGKKKSYTEWYNPETGMFEMGPKMPVNSAHGLCSARAPSGLIYLAAVRQPGMTRTFVFDPKSRNFTELEELSVEKRYPACNSFLVGGPTSFDEVFVVAGGGKNIKLGTDTVHVYNNDTMVWTDGPPLPHKVYGAASVDVGDSVMPVVGGITPGGEKPTQGYITSGALLGYNSWFDIHEYDGVGRLYPIGVGLLPIEHDCT